MPNLRQTVGSPNRNGDADCGRKATYGGLGLLQRSYDMALKYIVTLTW